MGNVTALFMDVITEKSGHSIVPMAVSVCLTPAAPSPLPIPYPVFATSVEGIIDPPMRTKINGAKIATVGSCIKTCHGNEPGTLKEVVSLNTTGPCFLTLGAPIVLCELGMMGITGSLCISNKAITVGAGATASGAGGAGSGGGAGGSAGGGGGGPSGPSGPGGGGGSGGGGSNDGASAGSSSAPPSNQCTQEGHPVDVATGYVVDEATDIVVPGMIPLVWTRQYSSSRWKDKSAALGPGWVSSYDQWIEEGERVITLRDGEGRSIWFGKAEPGESTFHRRERLTLSRDGANDYRIHSLDTRLTRVFSADAGHGRARLRAIRDVHGNEIRFGYEGDRLVQITDTAGRELLVKWSGGRITRLEVRAEGSLQQWVDYGYGPLGCLTAATDALGHGDQYEYDRFGRMTAAVLKNNARFQYAYSGEGGRCAKTWGEKGLHKVAFVADPEKKTVRVEGEEPRIYTWNDAKLVVKAELPDGTVLWEKAYDDDCLLIAETNGAGEGTQLWYDARGNKIREVDAAGSVTAWEYENDLPVRQISADGLVTQLVRDARGEITAALFPTGLGYSLSYDDRGHLTGLYGASGLVFGYEYDAQHNRIAETDARGARTTYTHDAMGRPLSRTDALGRKTEVVWDRLDRAVLVRRPDGSSTRTEYDALGNAIEIIDALGESTRMSFCGTGALEKVVEASGGVWRFAYTSKERLREIKNPKNEVYSFTYDQAGRIVEEKTFDGRVLKYRYSDAGRLSRVEYPDNTWRDFSYDRSGNLLGDEAPDGTVSYQRDRMGRLIAAVLAEKGGAQIVTRFERDAFGRLVCERQGDRTLRFAYDMRGRRIERVMPDGATTRYAWDELDALMALDHNGHRVVFERDILGREVQKTSGPSGIAIRSAYDAMDRLVEQRATAPAPGSAVPGVLLQRQWQYDKRGRVTRIDDARWGTTTYSYDAIGQLLKVTRGARQEIFEYDGAGSIRRMLDELSMESAAAQKKWELQPGNVLWETNKAKYAYDKRGRRVGKLDLVRYRAENPKGGNPTREDLVQYTWDCRDRLREVKLPGGDRVVMSYDAFGRRIRKEVLSGTSSRTRAVDFVWDGDALAAEVDTERGARTFVHLPGTLYPLLQEERREVFTYVNDHLGTPRELIDAAGLVAWAAAHSAWGKVVETHADPMSALNHGRKIDSPFRLLGQYADDETGLCYTRFRYFDPEIGAWCSPDPLGFRGGDNLFGFNGSPTLVSDPLGLASFLQTGTMATLTGGSNTGDGLDAHEVLQNAWLQQQGISTGRSSQVGRQNPAIALPSSTRPGIHRTINEMQKQAGLHDPNVLASQTASQNIDLNARILEQAMIQHGVDPKLAKAKADEMRQSATNFANQHVPPCKR